MRRAGRALWAVLPVVVAAGCFTDADVPVATARREPFQRTIVAEGNLKASRATPIPAPLEAEGPLRIAWMLPDGSRVEGGQVVVRFDPTEKEKEVADGKSDRGVSDLRIAKRAAEDGAALRNLERDARQAQLELEQARTFQSKDPLVFSRTQIIESEIDQDLAGRRADHADAARATKASLSRTDLDLLAIERRKAELKIRDGERGLRALEVTAPHDGILTYERNWRGDTPRVGETVWSGQPVAELPHLGEMEAEVFVLEADAGGLGTGLDAAVRVEARSDAVFAARVERVDSLARPRVRGSPVQYFGLTLSLGRTDPEVMKPGQRVRAEIVLDHRAEALVVPREAIFERDGRKLAFRRRGGSFEPVEVVLGPVALGRVVVEAGLEAGDEVALRDPERPEPRAPARDTPAEATPAGPLAATGGS
jgi:multidrug efflux pump subunit AcrA (membrane-fusion protein)